MAKSGFYDLHIDGCIVGTHLTIADIFSLISQAYGGDDDWYERVVKWELRDCYTGAWCGAEMAGGIWEACCETPEVFRVYLNCILGWENERIAPY